MRIEIHYPLGEGEGKKKKEQEKARAAKQRLGVIGETRGKESSGSSERIDRSRVSRQTRVLLATLVAYVEARNLIVKNARSLACESRRSASRDTM